MGILIILHSRVINFYYVLQPVYEIHNEGQRLPKQPPLRDGAAEELESIQGPVVFVGGVQHLELVLNPASQRPNQLKQGAQAKESLGNLPQLLPQKWLYGQRPIQAQTIA